MVAIGGWGPFSAPCCVAASLNDDDVSRIPGRRGSTYRSFDRAGGLPILGRPAGCHPGGHRTRPSAGPAAAGRV